MDKQIYSLIELENDQFQSVWTQKIELIKSNWIDTKQSEQKNKMHLFFPSEELELILLSWSYSEHKSSNT